VATRERSPNYPTIDLEAAVAAVDAIYRREKRGQVPWSLAAKAMGYQALSGPVRSRIAALRQYGLIDIAASETLRVSDRGFDLVASPKDSQQHVKALRDAALEPPIFRELVPMQEQSDDSLVYHLQRQRKFSEEGARRATKAFRATMAFAKLDNGSYDGGTDEDVLEEESVHEQSATGTATVAPHRVKVPDGIKGVPSQQFSFPLPGGGAAQITFTGAAVTKDTWDALERFIGVAKAFAPQEPVRENGEDGTTSDN
jgi:hypothetical protein